MAFHRPEIAGQDEEQGNGEALDLVQEGGGIEGSPDRAGTFVPGGVQGDDGKDRQHPEHVDGEKAGHGPILTPRRKMCRGNRTGGDVGNCAIRLTRGREVDHPNPALWPPKGPQLPVMFR
jgi:hypothetical protein